MELKRIAQGKNEKLTMENTKHIFLQRYRTSFLRTFVVIKYADWSQNFLLQDTSH